MSQELYSILGLEPGACGEEVDRAYRRLARRYPPELNPERFAEIHRAYRLLSSPEERMAEVREAPEKALDALFPLPRIELRPAAEPPGPPAAGDLEPLLGPLRRDLLRRLLRELGGAADR